MDVLVVIGVCFVLLSGLVVNYFVDAPYMDEIFHVSQTQAYCDGRYDEWNGLITTLPGLYVWTTVLMGVLRQECSVVGLRTVNLLWPLLQGYTLYKLGHRLGTPPKQVLLLLLFPLQFFFFSVYYTDSMSTCCILVMYSLALNNKHMLSALVGGVSIGVRQNNIFWVMFCAMVSIVKTYELGGYSSSTTTPKEVLYPTKLTELLPSLRHFLLVVLRGWVQVVAQCWSYICVGIGFVVFVVWNGGVVVGDRDNHIAFFHGVQPLYFTAVVLVFHPMSALTHVGAALRSALNHYRTTLIMFVLYVFLVYRCTYGHPFILADNRHLSFYVWKNAFRRHAALKYVYVPVYMYGTWMVNHMLSSSKSLVWRVSYAFCVVVYLSPMPLFEFRYFIIPFLILKLHCSNEHQQYAAWHTLYWMVVSAIVLYVFAMRPFLWPNGSTARFMW